MSTHCRHERFAEYWDAVGAAVRASPGMTFEVRWCDTCSGWHLYAKALRYVHR